MSKVTIDVADTRGFGSENEVDGFDSRTRRVTFASSHEGKNKEPNHLAGDGVEYADRDENDIANNLDGSNGKASSGMESRAGPHTKTPITSQKNSPRKKCKIGTKPDGKSVDANESNDGIEIVLDVEVENDEVSLQPNDDFPGDENSFEAEECLGREMTPGFQQKFKFPTISKISPRYSGMGLNLNTYHGCSPKTMKPLRYRRRIRPTITSVFSSISTILIFFQLRFFGYNYLSLSSFFVKGTITWNNGPEDQFFCGSSWDDSTDCAERQNCRSGKDDECEGYINGEKCFANTNCDSKYGGGHSWISQGKLTFPPTFSPSAPNTGSPTSAPNTGQPTKIPTEMPIGPPPPLKYPSDDPTDHWFCGIGFDDANQKCDMHCPTANECPSGQICYFGTVCDVRTHSPTPPPTRRPTEQPTMRPTNSPTRSMSPSQAATVSKLPSVAPSNPIPTRSPTPAPTGKPTYAPLTAVQSAFFCGLDWTDAITNCKKRCPSGEDPECPGDEFCFAHTGCREEKGYPDGYFDDIPGGFVDTNGDNGGKEDVLMCVPFEVTIVPDNWPQETSWDVKNEEGDTILTGTNDELVPKEPKTWLECIPERQCYYFTIRDSSGDGICCSHGDGSYEIKFNGQPVKNGAAFSDSETTEFGKCDTPLPTNSPISTPPTKAPVEKVTIPAVVYENENSSDDAPSVTTAFRCVATPLVQAGYVVATNICDKFIDCYNEFVQAGDDWFCDDSSQCIDTPACHGADSAKLEDLISSSSSKPPSRVPTIGPTTGTPVQPRPARPVPNRPITTTNRPLSTSYLTSSPTNKPTVQVPAQRPTAVTRPVPSDIDPPKPDAVQPTSSPTTSPTTSIPTAKPTVGITYEPTVISTEVPSFTPSAPTLSPTHTPTYQGPCDGEQCQRTGFCRSQFGFCGPGDTYCNERSIWTEECTSSTSNPTTSATTVQESGSPSIDFLTSSPISYINSSFQKPDANGRPKPSGGKGPSSKPATSTPASSSPTNKVTTFFTKVPTSSPTVLPTQLISDPLVSNPTPMPSLYDTVSSESLDFVILTNPPTNTLSNNDFTTQPSKQPTSLQPSEIMHVSTVQPSRAPQAPISTDISSSTSDDKSRCSGDPCPLDSQCRSRYDTCGPGFIYCNSFSIWDTSCGPAVQTVNTTHLKPTTAAPSIKSQISAEVPTVMKPTLPPLAMPTLPTITVATQANTSLLDLSSQAHSSSSELNALEKSGESSDSVNDTSGFHDENEQTASKPGDSEGSQESEGFIQEWSEWTSSRNSGSDPCFETFPLKMSVYILAVISIIFS